MSWTVCHYEKHFYCRLFEVVKIFPCPCVLASSSVRPLRDLHIQGFRVKWGLSCVIWPWGRQGPAATPRQHCPQMTQRCCKPNLFLCTIPCLLSGICPGPWAPSTMTMTPLSFIALAILATGNIMPPWQLTWSMMTARMLACYAKFQVLYAWQINGSKARLRNY